MDEWIAALHNFFSKEKKGTFTYTLTSTVTPGAWISFLIAASLVTLMVLWAFLGEIPITISGRGLIVTESGFSSLQAPFTGLVKKVNIKPEDSVKKGEVLIQGMEPHQTLVSPSDGQILEVWVEAGESLKEGAPVLWMENSLSSEQKGKFVIYGYFPIESGKRLQVNTQVEITVPSVNPNKYGTLQGKVKTVSLFAVSKETILQEIQNKNLVDYLMQRAPAVVKVVIEPHNWEWTSGLTPEEPLTTGTLVTLEATVEKVRPIYYLLPMADFKSSEGDLNGS